jgi:hypothetical protein
MMVGTPKASLQWNPQGCRKRGNPKIVREDRFSEKRGEAGRTNVFGS